MARLQRHWRFGQGRGILPAVRDLPGGTVTFLFTDIEGSTRLLHDVGARAYDEALTEHRRVLREAFARHGGVEVDTQGDAFFYAFPTAPGALEAAAEGQRALRSGPVRVRMGLHTGTPHLGEEGYVGNDVHRAARIAAAGHGGQVLLSDATRALVDGSALRDLGEHRLKDLSAPERLYQIGGAEFPALKTLYHTNLPVPATPFLGRERELRDVVELLERGDIRLLTLSGPGGTGKTRLALQAAAETAERFPDGLAWVSLAPLRDPALVVAAVAQALGLKEEPGRSQAEIIVDHLSGRRHLLLLDNAEHLLPQAAADIARFLQAPAATLLVTSRERLQLQGEQVWLVPPLVSEDGVALFTARAGRSALRSAVFARRAQPLRAAGQPSPRPRAGGCADDACSRPSSCSSGWGNGSTSSRQDAMPIRASRPCERRSAGRTTCSTRTSAGSSASLAVFVGGCTYEAAEAVVRRRSGQPPVAARQEPAAPARQRPRAALLDAGDDPRVRGRAARGGRGNGRAAAPPRRLLPGARRAGGAGDVGARAADLVRPARFGARQPQGCADRVPDGRRPGHGDEAGGRTRALLETRGYIGEGLGHLRRVLAVETGVAKVSRAKALFAASRLVPITSPHTDERFLLEEAVTLFAEAGEHRRHVFSLSHLALALDRIGEPEEARRRHEEAVSLAQALDDRWLLAMALNNLSCTLIEHGDYLAARPLAEEGLALRRALGEKRGIAISLSTVAELALAAGDGRERDSIARGDPGAQVAGARPHRVRGHGDRPAAGRHGALRGDQEQPPAARAGARSLPRAG